MRRDRASQDVTERGADGNRKVEDRDRVVAPRGRKQIRNPTGADRAKARFAEAHQHPEKNQRGQRAGVPRQQRAKTPHKDARRHQPP